MTTFKIRLTQELIDDDIFYAMVKERVLQALGNSWNNYFFQFEYDLIHGEGEYDKYIEFMDTSGAGL